jgi:membrane-associated phospholipid phosphatase
MKKPGFRALALLLPLFLCPFAAFAQDLPDLQVQEVVTEQPPPQVPALGGLFTSLASDFKSLPTRTNFSVLGAGLASAGAFLRSDAAVSSRLSSAGWADGKFGATALTGQFPLHLAAGFAAYGIGWQAGSARTAWLGADLVRAQLLAQGTTQAIKVSVGRTRPDGTTHSFPSGHTSTMFATATVLQRHLGWAIGAPAYAAATYVAAGRIQTRRHYLSDVAFGAALGVIAGRTVTVGRGPVTFSVAPMATPSGAGVSVTLVD